jgi:hypothetical protein
MMDDGGVVMPDEHVIGALEDDHVDCQGNEVGRRIDIVVQQGVDRKQGDPEADAIGKVVEE